MSFEGYYRLLCEDGHLSERDVYDTEFYWQGKETKETCHCGKPFVWENTVDETNGVDKELGYCPGNYPLEILEEAKYETCEHCQTTKIVEPIRYKIPSKNPDKRQ